MRKALLATLSLMLVLAFAASGGNPGNVTPDASPAMPEEPVREEAQAEEGQPDEPASYRWMANINDTQEFKVANQNATMSFDLACT